MKNAPFDADEKCHVNRPRSRAMSPVAHRAEQMVLKKGNEVNAVAKPNLLFYGIVSFLSQITSPPTTGLEVNHRSRPICITSLNYILPVVVGGPMVGGQDVGLAVPSILTR